MADFIQKATAKMKKKGTIGAFGKATEKNIAAGKKEGGVEKKRAVFAQNMKRIAAKHKGKQEHHKAIGSHEGYRL